MLKKVLHILRGKRYWNWLRLRYAITYKKVVLVLTGDNEKLDYYCLKYLEDFIRRKYANSAIIISPDEKVLKNVAKMKFSFPIELCLMDKMKMTLLYDFYSYMKFFDNIVFTYTSIPKDNLLGKILAETNVNEEDAACLALYHLRIVPNCIQQEKKYV